MNVDTFISRAGGYGPCVGIHGASSSAMHVPSGVELRIINGAHVKKLDSLYNAFGSAWHFPKWFGRNRDAFDDVMRDLDNMLNTATGKPPASGYLTEITDAQLLLAEQPSLFPWFAECIPFYRNYYRDDVTPPAAFGLLLTVPSGRLDQVRQRWVAAGIQVADVTA